MAAVLCSGLRYDSRIMMKFAGQKVDINTLLLALTVDKLAILCWSKTKDAEKGQNRPESVFKALSGIEEKGSGEETETFEDIKDFEERRREILREVNNG